MLRRIVVTGFRQQINLVGRPSTAAAPSLSKKPSDPSQGVTCQKMIFLQNSFSQYSTCAKIPKCSYEEVKDLPNHPEKLLIDVREPAELKETGKIPTSINIPLGIVGQELAPSTNKKEFKTKYGRDKPNEKTELIFHCKSGKRSGQAAEIATTMGYINVKNFEGSWLEWAEKQKLPK